MFRQFVAPYLKEMIDEFKRFAGYHGISCETVNDSQQLKIYRFRYQNRSSELLVCFEKIPALKPSGRDYLIVQDYDEMPAVQSKNGMVINLVNKNRIGTSEIGEDFVRFLSRYGVRFNRSD